MPGNIHLVYSTPPAGISDDEFNGWYDPHLDEILVVPGFASAQRYRLEPQVNTHGLELPFRYLSLYELEGDVDRIMSDLDEEAASGRMRLPGWFGGITFASWNARPIGGKVLPRR